MRATGSLESVNVLVVGDDVISSALATQIGDAGLPAAHCAVDAAADAVVETEAEIMLVLMAGWSERKLLDFVCVIRSQTNECELIILDDSHRAAGVSALHIGADDYLVGSSISELMARLGAKLRRRTRMTAETRMLSAGVLTIDMASREVLEGETGILLRRREFDLLVCLASQPDRVLTKRQILEQVWGLDADWVSPATVTEHVRRVRHKLNGSAGHIQTVRGVGYRFRSSL